MVFRWVGYALITLAFAGCYSPDLAALSGHQRCSSDGSCAAGLHCGSDGVCYLTGKGPGGDGGMHDGGVHDFASDDSGGGCSSCGGATPVCDVSSMTCVACIVDGDCGVGERCGSDHNCHPGCSEQKPLCAPDAGMCDVDLGACRGCLTDGDCSGGASSRCDTTTGHCVGCLPANDNCPSGFYCSATSSGYTCVNGCKSKSDCGAGDAGAGKDCCNHACIDVTADSSNCGGCDLTCSGATCCGSSCVDTTSNASNCGGCGKVCSIPNATAKCSASACAVGSCNTGYGDCDSDGKSCETNLTNTVANCGSCGHACSPSNVAAPACKSSQCDYTSCKSGYGDCDGNRANGCETQLNSVQNCLSCGAACSEANVNGPLCGMAGCDYGSCVGGYYDCDGSRGNGCETQNGVNNCGSCGHACNGSNVVNASGIICNGASCDYGSCVAPFQDCDGNRTDGCESNKNTDSANCGACGRNCASLEVNVSGPHCNGAGTCTYNACTGNFQDCDGNTANGCESNRLTDSAHCGSCGVSCGGGPCTNGSCGCVPSGGRAPFTTESLNTTTGCEPGSPCASDTSGLGNGRVFENYNESIACAGAQTCVGHVGIDTWATTTSCQGGWNVYCDGVLLGTLNTLGKTCSGSAMTNGCNITFAPRLCSTITMTAVNVGTTPGDCCVGGNTVQPDSAVSALSAW